MKKDLDDDDLAQHEKEFPSLFINE